MTERQSRHPDNELIDELTGEPTPSQSSSAGGEVNRQVGKRAELNRAIDPEDRERATGSDNPAQDAAKGQKTMDAIKKGRQG